MSSDWWSGQSSSYRALLQASDNDRSGPDGSQLPALESLECGNHVIGGILDVGSEFERRLAVGAQLACQLRTAVKDKLGMRSQVNDMPLTDQM